MDLKDATTQELVDTRDALAANSLSEFRTVGVEAMNKEQRAEAAKRGRLIEAINAEVRTRSDYEAVTGAKQTEARNLKPVATNPVIEVRERPQEPTREEYREAARETENRTGVSNYSRTGSLSAANYDLDQQFRSAIFDKDRKPIFVPIKTAEPTQPGLERRDVLKSTATQALPTDVFGRIIDHLVEESAVIAAGATVLQTATGNDLVVPKDTAFSTATYKAEGATLGESDPTLATVTLKAHKFGVFFQVSHEFLNDGHPDLLNYLARQAAHALSLAYGPKFVTGTGTNEPRGIIADAGVGVTAANGIGAVTSLGTQGSDGEGTDLLWDLYGSLGDAYASQPATNWLMRNASRTIVRKLRDTTGQPVAWNLPGQIYVDPTVAAMAASAKSIILGDFSRYFIRFAEGVRFERSDDFAFTDDLVTFKAVVRVDGTTVDTNAFKVLVNAAS